MTRSYDYKRTNLPCAGNMQNTVNGRQAETQPPQKIETFNQDIFQWNLLLEHPLWSKHMKLSALHTELVSNWSASQPAVQRGKVINLQSHKSKTTSLQLSLSFGFQAPLFPLRIIRDFGGNCLQIYWTRFGILMTLRKRYFLKKIKCNVNPVIGKYT